MEGAVLGSGSPGRIYAFYTGLPGLDRHLEIFSSEPKTQIFQLPTNQVSYFPKQVGSEFHIQGRTKHLKQDT